MVAQLAGAAAVTALFGWLVPPLQDEAKDVVPLHLRVKEIGHDR